MTPHNGNKMKPHLMSLPAEIRLLVYEHLFSGVEYRSHLVQPWHNPQHWYWVAHAGDKPQPHVVALLTVNRLIHTEAALLPYKFGTFVFSTLAATNLFFRACPVTQTAAVRKVRFMGAYRRRWQRGYKAKIIGPKQSGRCVQTWPRFVGVGGLQVIPQLFANSEGEEIGGQYPEMDKELMAEHLVGLRDELQKCMPGLKRFSVGTVLEGASGMGFIKEMEERMEISGWRSQDDKSLFSRCNMVADDIRRVGGIIG